MTDFIHSTDCGRQNYRNNCCFETHLFPLMLVLTCVASSGKGVIKIKQRKTVHCTLTSYGSRTKHYTWISYGLKAIHSVRLWFKSNAVDLCILCLHHLIPKQYFWMNLRNVLNVVFYRFVEKEKGQRDERICGGRSRQRRLYTSTSNEILIVIVKQTTEKQRRRFLIKYQGR